METVDHNGKVISYLLDQITIKDLKINTLESSLYIANDKVKSLTEEIEKLRGNVKQEEQIKE